MKDNILWKVRIKRSRLYRWAAKQRKHFLWNVFRNGRSQIAQMTVEEASECAFSYCRPPETKQPEPRHSFGNCDKDLSIIIPVYNVAPYICQCMDSVVSQKTVFQVEILVIDDGSTDASAELLKAYEGLPQVQVIHKENGGLSSARNEGIRRARGRYLLFLDSDDYLTEGCIDAAIKKAEEEKCDIVQMQYLRLAGERLLPSEDTVPEGIFEEYRQMCRIPGYAWMKVYRSSLFDGILFPEGYWFEDTIVHLILFCRCKRMAVMSRIGYVYRYNPQGIVYSSKYNKRNLESMWVLFWTIDFRYKLGMRIHADVYEELLYHASVLLYSRIKNAGEKLCMAAFVLCCEEVQKWRRDLGGEYEALNAKSKELDCIFAERNYGLWKLYCLCN